MSGIAKVQAAERANAAARAAEDEADRARSNESTAKTEEAIQALAEAKRAKGDEAKRRAAHFFEYLSNEFGEEAARAAWRLAPPKRGCGYHVSEAKRQRDALILATDDTLQELGLTAQRAAEWIIDHSDYAGPNADPRSVRRTLNRLRKKQREAAAKVTPAHGAAHDLGLK